jgi:vacuolar iron transporter family protein
LSLCVHSHAPRLLAVFGGLDGILTSFAIVAGAAGGGMTPQVVLVLGFSNIFADALSMGVGEFLSSKAHNEWVLSERKREKWELDNYPEGEVRLLVLVFFDEGIGVRAHYILLTPAPSPCQLRRRSRR